MILNAELEPKTIVPKFTISTDEETVRTGDMVTIIQSDLPWEFDNIRCEFEPNLYYYYIVDIEIKAKHEIVIINPKDNRQINIETYTGRIVKVYEKTY